MGFFPLSPDRLVKKLGEISSITMLTKINSEKTLIIEKLIHSKQTHTFKFRYHFKGIKDIILNKILKKRKTFLNTTFSQRNLLISSTFTYTNIISQSKLI